MTEQQLLWALRGVRWEPRLQAEVPVIWGLHAHRAVGTEPLPSRIVCEGVAPGDRAGAGGWFEISVTVKGEREPLARFWIAADAPYSLMKYEGSSGRKLELDTTRRWAYWQRGK